MPCLASSCLVPASHRVASRRGLLPLIGWASCFKSTSHSLSTVALFVPATALFPLTAPIPPAALPFACRRANLRGLCLSCFPPIPLLRSKCSSSFSTQWRVKSVNRRRRQSVLQVAALAALHYPTPHLPAASTACLPELAMFLIEKRFFNYVSQLLFGAAAAAAAPTAPGWLPCCVPFNLLFLLPFRYPWGLTNGTDGYAVWIEQIGKYTKNNYN